MKSRSLLPALAVLIIFIGGCGNRSADEQSSAEPVAINSLFEAYSDFRLRINPVEATKIGENRYNDHVANYLSDAYRQDLIGAYTQFLAAIDQIDPESLTESQQLSLQVMKWDCEVKYQGLTNSLATIASPVYDLPHFRWMPLDQTWSFHLYFAQLGSGTSVQPFHSVEDYDNWLSRVDDYIAWLRTAMDLMREGIEEGVVWPKAIIQKMIDPMNGLISESVEDHIFYQPIKTMPGDFPAEDRNRLQIAYRKMIVEKINPAHRTLLKFLTDIYLPAGSDHAGIGALPHGKETYRYLIKYHTTTNMSPDEIFALGEKEVARITAEMETLKEEIGFRGDLKAFLDDLRSNKEQMPFSDPDQVIHNFNVIHKTMQPHLGRLFGTVPKAGFEVRRTESFREASTGAHYVPGTKDGSRPGVFYVSITDVAGYNKFADEALFLHEAIPGHHYQLSLQQENGDLPAFLHPESMGVFVEGWALYTESLGHELGLYRDPYQRFGALSMEMHRAIRLVVDVGMHAKGWTREQAIQYSLDHEADSEASITSEIERYMTMPGQALSYKVGQLKIQELRQRAESTLGESFDIKEFHHQVLNTGSLPLVLLERKINSWIKERQEEVT
jgi:uncharacterized protein (DUF885 family)